MRYRMAFSLALTLAAASAPPAQAFQVFQDPGNTGVPGGTLAVNVGSNAAVNVWVQHGTTLSTPATVCSGTGLGDEQCGFDVHIMASGGAVITGFTAHTDIVAANTDKLRFNGGNPINGQVGSVRAGTMNVTCNSPGSVSVVGNLWVNKALTTAAVAGVTLVSCNPPDADGDGVEDSVDNCPTVANGAAQAGVFDVGNQTDTDGDLVGDACDNCVLIANPRVITALPVWMTATGGQRDDDADGFGNKCDGKFAAGTVVGSADTTRFVTALGDRREDCLCGLPGTEPCDRYDVNESANSVGSPDTTHYTAQLLGKSNSSTAVPPGPLRRCPTCPLTCAGDACAGGSTVCCPGGVCP